MAEFPDSLSGFFLSTNASNKSCLSPKANDFPAQALAFKELNRSSETIAAQHS